MLDILLPDLCSGEMFSALNVPTCRFRPLNLFQHLQSLLISLTVYKPLDVISLIAWLHQDDVSRAQNNITPPFGTIIGVAYFCQAIIVAAPALVPSNSQGVRSELLSGTRNDPEFGPLGLLPRLPTPIFRCLVYVHIRWCISQD